MVRVFSRVIVGWQNGIDKGKGMEQAVGVCEDLWDAIFDACRLSKAANQKSLPWPHSPNFVY